jgi:hypothetical protein
MLGVTTSTSIENNNNIIISTEDKAKNKTIQTSSIKKEIRKIDDNRNTSILGDDPSSRRRDPKKLVQYRTEIEALVRRVVPEEMNNIDEMMDQYNGREEELIETLRTMQERAVAQKARRQTPKLEGNSSESMHQNQTALNAAMETAIEAGDWAAVGKIAAAWSADSSPATTTNSIGPSLEVERSANTNMLTTTSFEEVVTGSLRPRQLLGNSAGNNRNDKSKDDDNIVNENNDNNRNIVQQPIATSNTT